MAALGMIVMIGGIVVAVVASIWLLIIAFDESVMWGLGCLLVPFVGLIFVITHWERSAKPFLLNLGGVGIMFLGMLVGSAGGGRGF